MYRIRSPFVTNTSELFRTFDELMEIYESDSMGVKNEKEFSVEIPFAGLSKENIHLEVNGKTLIVKTKINDATGYCKRYQDHVYSYQLTDLHDLNSIEANMKNGLLGIRVPLKEKKTESIKVEVK